MTRVGFAGLGRMGAPMARRIAGAGLPLTVWNRTADKAARFAAESGATLAATPGDLGGSADVLVTMLANDDAVRSLLLAPEGALSTLAPGSLVIDMSTVSPATSAAVRAAVAEAGSRFVEAPVSGSTVAADTGTLLILAGGSAADVDAARPVLDTMGREVVRVGDAGAGIVMKLAVNNIVYGLSQSVAESLVLAERAGIDREAAFAVFADSAIAAPMVHYRRDLFERPGQVEPTFALDLAIKDLGLISDLAAEVGAAVPQAGVNLHQLVAASAAGYGSWDMSAVAEHLRGRTTTAGPTDG